MAPFRFQLARVLEWYRTQCRLAEERLRLCVGEADRAAADLERHRKDALARQMELIQAPEIQAAELAALGSFRHRAKQRELQLLQRSRQTEQALEQQRGIALAAQRCLRLIEKLRDRRLSEYQYEAALELEALASESYLASLARGASVPLPSGVHKS